ncbi:basic proline-rich protein-like [Dama dama]|uniref:basic proline-rich protein-like n=1 Tax=Dama dama TaxID=30532 RepID=UPI002A370B73|nr:basic proline-rich protein-like [Dama dama]
MEARARRGTEKLTPGAGAGSAQLWGEERQSRGCRRVEIGQEKKPPSGLAPLTLSSSGPSCRHCNVLNARSTEAVLLPGNVVPSVRRGSLACTQNYNTHQARGNEPLPRPRLQPAAAPPPARRGPASSPPRPRLQPAAAPPPARRGPASSPPRPRLQPAAAPPPTRRGPASSPPRPRLQPAAAPPPARRGPASSPPRPRLTPPGPASPRLTPPHPASSGRAEAAP